MRSEPFGGLVYCYRTRSLHVVKSAALVKTIQRLEDGLSLNEALASVLDDGDPRSRLRREALLRQGLDKLAQAGVLA